MGGVDKALVLKEDRAIKRKIATEKYSKVNSTGATTSVPWSKPEGLDGRLSS